jgi:hypothetical protein
MTDIPFPVACSMLAVPTRTLQRWLKHSNLSLQRTPTGICIKCLTIEQVQQLATLHGRFIKHRAVSLLEGKSPSVSPEKPAEEQKASLETPVDLESHLSPAFRTEPKLFERLSSLQATVATLQQQVTECALELRNQRDIQFEQRLSTLEICVGSSPPQQVAEVSAVIHPQGESSSARWYPKPVELRSRSRTVSLIKYTAHGTYLVISPQEGEISLTPDSPEWFDWLASLSSFRFLGRQGRFNAYRECRQGHQTRSWTAHRSIDSHRYKHYLGVTNHLTISRLEQIADRLQSYGQCSN